MEFECGSMTSFGCERMDGVKELIMAEIEEAIEEIKEKDEELRQEKLLGIKCYNCAKEINQEGHKANIRSDEADCVWLCDDCFKKALFFIDFIDEKRPYQAFTGIVLWKIPENDFFLIFSFTALYFHMGNSISFCTHSERRGCINTRSCTGYSLILPKQLLPHHLH